MAEEALEVVFGDNPHDDGEDGECEEQLVLVSVSELNGSAIVKGYE